MRAAFACIAFAAACTPDIVSGAYLCGPEQFCPEGQSCNGPDNTCVATGQQTAFACDPMDLHEPDDTPAQAFVVPGLTCVSGAVIEHGCLAAGDAQNWLQIAAPAGCVKVVLTAQLTFPLAFEPVVGNLYDATGTNLVTTTTTCAHPGAIGPGNDALCISQQLTPGMTYALQIAPAGGSDCAGQCAYNRYNLTVQLGTN
jgi:hypothetical protein